jgi:hypothetical protein
MIKMKLFLIDFFLKILILNKLWLCSSQHYTNEYIFSNQIAEYFKIVEHFDTF